MKLKENMMKLKEEQDRLKTKWLMQLDKRMTKLEILFKEKGERLVTSMNLQKEMQNDNMKT